MMMTNQKDSGKLARVAAQVGCGSFAAVMLGTTATMAEVVNPEDSMFFQRIDLTTGSLGKFEFDLDGDGKDDFKVRADPKKGTIIGTERDGRESKISKKLFSVGDIIDNSASPFAKSVKIYDDTEISKNLGLGIGQTEFLGLAIFDEGEDETFFGWVEITRGSVEAGRAGFQTLPEIGAPIPPVPVPASLPLLALGIGGLAALRRKRKAA